MSTEVYTEVVVAGAGLPGAAEVANAQWIEVKQIQNQAALAQTETRFQIGSGELSSIILAREVKVEPCSSTTFGRAGLLRAKALQFAALSAFWNSCIGGARFRIFGPCF